MNPSKPMLEIPSTVKRGSWRINDTSYSFYFLTGRLAFGICFTLASVAFFANHKIARILYLKPNSNEAIILSLKEVNSINRPSRQYDEFFKKPPSQAAVDSFFNFNSSLYLDATVRIDPLWTCVDGNDSSTTLLRARKERERKLVFIHMTRSAGSAVRALLRAYANSCLAGIAVVDHCVDLGIEFMTDDEIWSNGKGSHSVGKPCFLNSAVSRSNSESFVKENIHNVSTALLKKLNIDIVAGSVPLGCLDYLHLNQSKPVDVQYFTIFREPLSKLVSELTVKLRMVYSNAEEMSIDQIVDLIQKYVDHRMMDQHDTLRYSDKYSNYMITPEQKAWVENGDIEWTPERRVNLTLKNMYRRKVVIGIVDDMPSTIRLLNYAVDGTGQSGHLFQFFLSEQNDVNDIVTRNLTRAIVDQIARNDELANKIHEYLKYEKQVYEHALRLHAKQVEWVTQATKISIY